MADYEITANGQTFVVSSPRELSDAELQGYARQAVGGGQPAPMGGSGATDLRGLGQTVRRNPVQPVPVQRARPTPSRYGDPLGDPADDPRMAAPPPLFSARPQVDNSFLARAKAADRAARPGADAYKKATAKKAPQADPFVKAGLPFTQEAYQHAIDHQLGEVESVGGPNVKGVRIDQAIRAVGAKGLGPKGRADASMKPAQVEQQDANRQAQRIARETATGRSNPHRGETAAQTAKRLIDNARNAPSALSQAAGEALKNANPYVKATGEIVGGLVGGPLGIAGSIAEGVRDPVGAVKHAPEGVADLLDSINVLGPILHPKDYSEEERSGPAQLKRLVNLGLTAEGGVRGAIKARDVLPVVGKRVVEGLKQRGTWKAVAEAETPEAAAKIVQEEAKVTPEQAAQVVQAVGQSGETVNWKQFVEDFDKETRKGPKVEAKPVEKTPVAEPVRPVETPKAETTPKEPVKYAASNAGSEDLRAKTGLEPLPKARPTETNAATAVKTYEGEATLTRARQIAKDVAEGKKAPVLSHEEQLHFGRLEAEVGERYNAAASRLAKAYESGEDAASHEVALQRAREDVDAATLANRHVGSEQSRAFSARNQAYDHDLSPAGVYREWTIANKGKLDPKQAAESERIGRELEIAKARIDELESKQTQTFAQASLAKAKSRTPRSVEQIQQSRAAATERLKATLKANVKETVGRANSAEAIVAQFGKAIYEIAPDVKQIALDFAEEGSIRLSEVVKKVQAHVKKETGVEMDEADIHDILTDRYEKPKAGPQTPTAGQQQLTAWKRERADVDRLAKKIESDAKRKATAAARAEGRKIDSLTAELDRWVKKNARDKTAKEYEEIFGKRNRLDKSIQDIQARLKSGDLSPKVKPKPDPELQGARIKLEALRAEASARRATIENERKLKELGLPARLGKEAVNLPRALVATLDASAPLNQGAFAAYTHPAMSIRAVGHMLAASRNEKGLFNVLGNVRANPHYDKALASGLQLSVDSALNPGGDLFLSKLLGHPIGPSKEFGRYGRIDVNPIGASERAYSAYLNKLRMDMFAQSVNKAEKSWGPFKGKPLDQKQLKELADWVNVATGAGTGKFAAGLKQVNEAVPVMFAPGYMISRWQLAFGGVTRLPLLVRKNPRVAALILQDYARFAAAAGGIMYALSKNGYKVETDPRSSDFMKAQTDGGTSIDPFSGIFAPIRVTTQLTKGIKTEDGESKSRAANTLGYYSTGKLSPIFRTIFNVAGGEAFGKSYDVNTSEGRKNTVVSLGVPIQGQSQLELGDDKSLTPEQNAVLRLITFFGGSIQPPKARVEK